MCELRHTSLVVQKMHLRTPSPPAEKTTARLRYMRKKNRALVPSMNLDTPHPMNAAAGLCVLLRALGPPICGAAPDLHTGWEKDSRGADLTASVDLTAFERCDRRHKSAVRQRFIFWTTQPRRRRAAKRILASLY
jgi:hypothetical protein